MLLTWDFNIVNYADTLIDLTIALVQAIVILLLTNFLLNKIWMKSTSMGTKLFEYGIDKISIKDGRLNKMDKKQMFGLYPCKKPYELCFWFITGDGFIKDYSHLLVDVIKNGCKVKILLHNPEHNRFYSKQDPYTIERINQDKKIRDEMVDYYFNIIKGNNGNSYGDRIFAMYMLRRTLDNNSNQTSVDDYGDEKLKKTNETNLLSRGYYISEIVLGQELIEKIKQDSGIEDGIEVRYYIDEYRSTVMIAKYKNETANKTELRCWVNFASPMTAAQDSIALSSHPRKENKKNDDGNDESQFLKDMENSFDYTWNQYGIKK